MSDGRSNRTNKNREHELPPENPHDDFPMDGNFPHDMDDFPGDEPVHSNKSSPARHDSDFSGIEHDTIHHENPQDAG